MNRALLLKTARDTLGLFSMAVAAVILFEILFVLAMGSLAPELLQLWSSFGFLQDLFEALFGLDLSQNVSINTLIVVGYAHPILFVVSWGFLITICTRVTVGEIDRGTADVLLSLPISRAAVLATTSLVWVLASALICLAVWIGVWLGSLLVRLPEPWAGGRFAVASGNLLALNLAIGAATTLAASCLSRRGPAIAIMISILVGSYLINFLAAFLTFFERISFLGFLHYYRPVETIRDGVWPLSDMAVLAMVAALAWLLALGIFCRRNIPAV